MDDLLAHLRMKGTASARELGSALGVSQPSISRRIQAAGDLICRMGQTRATRYACTRVLPGLGPSLPLHRVDPEGRCTSVGRLWLLDGGRHWLPGAEILFEGLPPFASDMRPQGYFGKSFSARYPELELPSRTTHWSDDQVLVSLARRGEDCVGELLLGEESLERWFRLEPVSLGRADFPQWALRSEKEHVGSSAGGEQPKFLTYSEGRHVLVWADAARHASRFWTRVAGEAALSEDYRVLARRCGERVELERARVVPRLGI